MSQIKIAILGTGFISQIHMESYRRLCGVQKSSLCGTPMQRVRHSLPLSMKFHSITAISMPCCSNQVVMLLTCACLIFCIMNTEIVNTDLIYG